MNMCIRESFESVFLCVEDEGDIVVYMYIRELVDCAFEWCLYAHSVCTYEALLFLQMPN